MKIWHDDIRYPPRKRDGTFEVGWYWARTNQDAMRQLLNHDVDEISLDHDLGLHGEDPNEPFSENWQGQGDENGFDLVCAMLMLRVVPPKVTIHSWNDEGAALMAATLREYGYEVTICPYRQAAMDDLTYAAMFKDWPA